MLKIVPVPIFTLKSENFTPNCLRFYLDDTILYVGTLSGEILNWNMKSNRLSNVTKAGTVCIMALELLIERNQLVSQNKVGEIKFWQIDGLELIHHHTLSTNIIGFCKFSLHKTNMLLCKGDKSTMNCYSAETFDKITVFDPEQSADFGDLMAIKSVKDHVFCGYESNMIVVWNGDKIVSQYSFPELECLMTLDVDSNASVGVCAGCSNVINTFSISEGVLSLQKSVKITNPGVNALRLRPDDKIVAAACWDFTARLFSWKSMKLLVVLNSHSTGVLDIAYSESSGPIWNAMYMLAVANKDNKITLWDVYCKKGTHRHFP